MANIFTNSPSLLDFEENDISDLDGSGTNNDGTIAASSTQAYAGTYSCRTICTDTSSSSAIGFKEVTWPGSNVGYVRAFVYFNDGGTADVTPNINHAIFGFKIQGDIQINTFTTRAIIGLNPANGDLFLSYKNDSGVSEVDTGLSLTEGQWQEIQLKYDNSGSDLDITLWVGNDSFNQNAGAHTTVGDPTYAFVGAYASFKSSASKDLFWDEVKAEDTMIISKTFSAWGYQGGWW